MAAVFGLDALADWACASFLEALGDFVDIGDLDVEVHPVLAGFGLRDALQQQLGSRPAVGYEHHVVLDTTDGG